MTLANQMAEGALLVGALGPEHLCSQTTPCSKVLISLCAGPAICAGECVETHKPCVGVGGGTQVPCCSGLDQCVRKNSYFAQCRPRDEGIPTRWPNGKVLEECSAWRPPSVLCAKIVVSRLFEAALSEVGKH